MSLKVLYQGVKTFFTIKTGEDKKRIGKFALFVLIGVTSIYHTSRLYNNYFVYFKARTEGTELLRSQGIEVERRRW